MHELGQLVREDILRLVELCALPGGHRLDLLDRKEGQHTDALHDVIVANVSPVLIEIKGRGFFGIEPNGTRLGLAHLLALGVEEQRDGHRVGILAELAADELGSVEHIRPLIVAAELHITAVSLVELEEVVALHDHIVELKEGEPSLKALLVALGGQHTVDREAGADVAQKLDII